MQNGQNFSILQVEQDHDIQRIWRQTTSQMIVKTTQLKNAE